MSHGSYDDVGRVTEEVRGPPGLIFADGFESGTAAASASGSSTGVLVYTFNAADQLTQVEEGGQALGVYAYDGDGLRVSATAEGATVYYLRDSAGNTLAEYDGSGELVAEYLYAGGRQLGKIVPDGLGGDDVSYFHPDHLGTAMLITNDAGALTWYGEYEPFGEPVTSTGTPDRYRFTQHELDTETNLVYAKARCYHPRIGRFLSTDPVGGEVGTSQSWNRYSYVKNNPLIFIDPDGRLQRKKNGELKAKRGQILAVGHAGDPGHSYVIQKVTLKTDKGNFIEASTVIERRAKDPTGQILDSSTGAVVDDRPDASNPMATDCHGATFADGKYWINNDQVDTILADDGYSMVTGGAQAGDVMIYRDSSGNVVHSMTVSAVDSSGTVTGVEGLAGLQTTTSSQAPGPGSGTAWSDPNATTEIYRRP